MLTDWCTKTFRKCSKNFIEDIFQEFSPKFINIFFRNPTKSWLWFSWSPEVIPPMFLQEFSRDFFRYTSSDSFRSTSRNFWRMIQKFYQKFLQKFLPRFHLKFLKKQFQVFFKRFLLEFQQEMFVKCSFSEVFGNFSKKETLKIRQRLRVSPRISWNISSGIPAGILTSMIFDCFCGSIRNICWHYLSFFFRNCTIIIEIIIYWNNNWNNLCSRPGCAGKK